jgi:hypothetical protein
MNNQPTKIKLKRRTSTVKKTLIEAGAEGMQMPELLALVRVNEPNLSRDTLAVWVANHQPQAQAVREGRNGEGYIWYHRGTLPKAPTPTPLTRPWRDRVQVPLIEGIQVRSAPTQQARVITITLPALPRITPLRVYAVGMTVLAATLTALEVL